MRATAPPCKAWAAPSHSLTRPTVLRLSTVPKPARLQASSQDDGLSIEQLLAEANALLDQATTQPRTGSVLKSLDEVSEVQEVEYVCDESGCVVVYPGMDTPDASLANVLSISGDSFKLEANRDVGVIMGREWDISVNSKDITTFVEVLQRLESVVNNLYAVGEWTDRTEDRPSSKVKWESGSVFMQATYSEVVPQPSFAVEFTISSSEGGVESGFWPSRIVKQVLTQLFDSMPPVEVELRKTKAPQVQPPSQAEASARIPTASNA